MTCLSSSLKKTTQLFRLIFSLMLGLNISYSAPEVIISEIHYNPNGPDEAREFIEIKNVGDEVADLSGWEFTNGVLYVFPNETFLSPGQFIVLVANAQFFATQYPGVQIFGQYADDDGAGPGRAGLSNRGERVTLKNGSDDTGSTVSSLRYYDGDDGSIPDPPELPEDDDLERASWPSQPDGGDYSLVLISRNGGSDEEDYESWRPSINVNGSPGSDEPLPADLNKIYINEIRTRDGVLDNDAIELYNPNTESVDLSGWFVSDNLDRPTKSPPLAEGTIISAGGYLVLENGINGFSISLSSKGERVFIYSSNEGVLTGWVQGFHFPASLDGKTFSRVVDDNGKDYLVPDEASLGFGNGLPSSTGIKIVEVMYSPGFGSSIEYIKIINNGPEVKSLFDPAFPSDNLSVNGFGMVLPGASPTLEVGEYAYITNVLEADFRAAYDVDDNDMVFADPNAGSLDGGGERIELRLPLTIEGFQRDAPGYPRYYAVLDSLDYDDESPWPVEADGQGYSLVRKSNTGSSYQASDWELSSNRGGSAFGGGVILVNEILSHTDLPQTDVIELYNPGNEDINIGGWYLTDDPINPKKYLIPSNSIVPAGGYWAVNEDNNAAPGAPLNYFGTSFSLSSRGDAVYLFSADSQNRLTGYAHGAEFRATQNGVSIIRYVNGAGNEIFVTQSGSPTIEINRFEAFPDGYSNNPPRVELAVISEISYEPINGGHEYIEITNISDQVLPLYDTTSEQLGGNPNNNWSLDGVDFTFPGNQPVLQKNEIILIIPKGVSVNQFRIDYSVPEDITIYGNDQGFEGALNNAGEKIVLMRPDKPDFVAGQGIVVPMIEVDAVDYDDNGEWPSGEGRSIERIDNLIIGNDPTNWQRSQIERGSPGVKNSEQVSGYSSWAKLQFDENGLNGPGTGPADDYDSDGLSNLEEYAYGLNPRSVSGLKDEVIVRAVKANGIKVLSVELKVKKVADDLVFSLQSSVDLKTWDDILGTASVDNGDGTITIRHDETVNDSDRRLFYRFLIELTP